MLSIGRIGAGAGYRYLTGQVASGDVPRSGESLLDYYERSGYPAGEWVGSGAANLGLAGRVEESDMEALFGRGVDPRDGSQLGRRLPTYRSVEERVAERLGALGHEAIVSVDTSARKREAALAAGATAVVDGNDPALHKAIIAACGGQPEAIIDLVNGSGTAKAAHAALAKGGKLIMVGLFGGELNIPLPFMPMRALTLQGSFVGTPGDLRELVDLAQGGALPKLQIETVPQREADAAIHRLKAGDVTGRLVLVADGA